MDRKAVVQYVSELEMLGFIKANGTECRFVGLVTKTPVVKMRVNNPWHVIKDGKVVGTCNLFKVAKSHGLVNANYNTSVRRRLADKLGVTLPEVEYTSGKCWYEHLLTVDGKPLPVVQHKEEAKREETGYGLQYFPLGYSGSYYVNGAGETVPDADVEKWLHAKSERPDYKPAVQAPKLKHILSLKASGVVIEMPELEEAQALFAD
jgi:hypothetical protein